MEHLRMLSDNLSFFSSTSYLSVIGYVVTLVNFRCWEMLLHCYCTQWFSHCSCELLVVLKMCDQFLLSPPLPPAFLPESCNILERLEANSNITHVVMVNIFIHYTVSEFEMCFLIWFMKNHLKNHWSGETSTCGFLIPNPWWLSRDCRLSPT